MKRTMTKRFYKTHSAIRAPQILMLQSEAVEAARCAIEDGKETIYYIVEVVQVVTRRPPMDDYIYHQIARKKEVVASQQRELDLLLTEALELEQKSFDSVIVEEIRK